MSERNLYDEYEAFSDSTENEALGTLPKITADMIPKGVMIC